MLKKIILLILSLMLTTTLIGCSEKSNEINVDGKNNQVVESTETNEIISEKVKGQNIEKLTNEDVFNKLYNKLGKAVGIKTYILQSLDNKENNININMACTNIELTDTDLVMQFDVYNLRDEDIQINFGDIYCENLAMKFEEKYFKVDDCIVKSKNYKVVTLKAPLYNNISKDDEIYGIESSYLIENYNKEEIKPYTIYGIGGFLTGDIQKIMKQYINNGSEENNNNIDTELKGKEGN